eukprot:TRINITY_DN26416_c0_g1_i1.p1 TRINITY_DN26416_c0_g1~~TRINITY_DN26416_c0_g1_i1.p1  ORF type:complete len:428 (-),score=77.02 TRINITY_DN26416_c0_g1_i1:192-1475(-)
MLARGPRSGAQHTVQRSPAHGLSLRPDMNTDRPQGIATAFAASSRRAGFLASLAGLWTLRSRRRPPLPLVRNIQQNESSQSSKSSHQSGLMLWAVAVGASVSVRLWCSVELTGTVVGMDPLAASCHVACRAMFLSAVCLAPFASWQHIPKTSGPWLAGLCTLPSASLINSSKVLGLGLTQMMLKLSTLSTALSLDAVSGRLNSGISQRLLGAFAVLVGVAVAAFGGEASASFELGPAFLACLAGTAVSGAGYVLQARFSADSGSSSADSTESEVATAAVVCQGVSAVAQALLLCLLSWQGCTTLFAFPMLQKDAHLWLLEGLQGAFFLRSMQILGKKLGLATTFTLSLCGQLTTAYLVDVLRGTTAAFVPSRLAGLALVLGGAVLSTKEARAPVTRVLDLRPSHVFNVSTGKLKTHKLDAERFALFD